jgi:hypothetical protein
MAYLVYTTSGTQIIHDEKMEEHKPPQNKAAVLARFPLTENEAGMTITQLELIYPYHQETKNGH